MNRPFARIATALLATWDAVFVAAAFGLICYFRIGSPHFFRLFNSRVTLADWHLAVVLDSAFDSVYGPYFSLVPFVVACQLACLAYFGAYRLRGELLLFSEFGKIFQAGFLSALIIVAFTFLYRGGAEFRTFSYSRSVFLIYPLAVTAGLYLTRLATAFLRYQLRKRGRNLNRVLLYGTTPVAGEFIRASKDEAPALGFKVVGVATEEPGEAKDFHGVPVVGSRGDLLTLAEKFPCDEIVVTRHLSAEEILDIVMRSGNRNLLVKTLPELGDFLPHKMSYYRMAGFPILEHGDNPIKGLNWAAKRALDLVISTVSLVILSPVLVLIALWIKRDSKGPVLFHQVRVGRDGRLFDCYKFRTMRVAEDDPEHREYMRKLIKGEVQAAEGNPKDQEKIFKLTDRSRLTASGRFLRNFSLDELPQLFNVLKGEMSLVGPRPAVPYEVEQYSKWAKRRLEIDQGITGLWQVSGRNRLPFDRMIELDLYYIENWSLWLDLKILVLTFFEVFWGRNSA